MFSLKTDEILYTLLFIAISLRLILYFYTKKSYRFKDCILNSRLFFFKRIFEILYFHDVTEFIFILGLKFPNYFTIRSKVVKVLKLLLQLHQKLASSMIDHLCWWIKI